MNSSEYFSCLDRAFGRDEEDSDHEVNFLGCFDPFVASEQESLVHEVGEVGDGWDAIAVEAEDCHLFQKLIQEGPVNTLASAPVSILGRFLSFNTVG